MKLLALISLLFLSQSLLAQGSWQILLNRKLQIRSSTSDETINKKTVKLSDWRSSTGYLDIRYKPEGATWKYTLQLTDEKGTEQWMADTTAAKLKLSTLRKLYAGRKELKIYIIINPRDSRMGAPSRLVHLATLKLP
jgi:hypothetical protein